MKNNGTRLTDTVLTAALGLSTILFCIRKNGGSGESNPGPSAPKAEIIPLDHFPLMGDSQIL